MDPLQPRFVSFYDKDGDLTIVNLNTVTFIQKHTQSTEENPLVSIMSNDNRVIVKGTVQAIMDVIGLYNKIWDCSKFAGIPAKKRPVYKALSQEVTKTKVEQKVTELGQ